MRGGQKRSLPRADFHSSVEMVNRIQENDFTGLRCARDGYPDAVVERYAKRQLTLPPGLPVRPAFSRQKLLSPTTYPLQ